MTDTTHSERLSSLQVLRGVAAFWVMAFHFTALTHHQSEAFRASLIGSVMWFGFAGVDIFFVLSGFVIWWTSSRAEGVVYAIRFLSKRLSRIYLGYWPCLAISILVATFWWPVLLMDKSRIGNVFLIGEGFTGLVIGQAWSLAYELYFYAVFFVLLLVAQPTRLRLVMALFVLCALWNFMQWQRGTPITSGVGSFVNFVASPFVCEFLAGIMLAEASSRWYGRRASVFAIILGTATAGAAFSFGSEAVREQGLGLAAIEIERVSSFGLGALGTVVAVIAAGKLGLRWPRFLVGLGDQSFSLYLLHVLILQVSVKIGYTPSVIDTDPLNILWWLGFTGCVIVMTRAFHQWVEHPLYMAACRKIEGWTGFPKT